MPETALETKVAILQNDMKQMEGLFGRLDIAIDKMSEVSNSIIFRSALSILNSCAVSFD